MVSFLTTTSSRLTIKDADHVSDYDHKHADISYKINFTLKTSREIEFKCTIDNKDCGGRAAYNMVKK